MTGLFELRTVRACESRQRWGETPRGAGSRSRHARAGFTLLETLIVVALLAILASVVLPAVNSANGHSLEAIARVIANDLRLARSLAIQQNTEWTLTFDWDNNAYELIHTGSGEFSPPPNPLEPGSRAGQYHVSLNGLGDSSRGGQPVHLLGATLKGSLQRVSDVTFGPLGGTGPSCSEDTILWLTRGSGSEQRYLILRISWVTGQVWIEEPDPSDRPPISMRADTRQFP